MAPSRDASLPVGIARKRRQGVQVDAMSHYPGSDHACYEPLYALTLSVSSGKQP